MSVDKMSVEKMSVDEMSVDEMSFGKMACCQTKLLQWKMIGQEQNGTNKLSKCFFRGNFLVSTKEVRNKSAED